MMGIGHLRKKRDEAVLRIDMFFYAYTFAFSMTLIRLVHKNAIQSFSFHSGSDILFPA